MNTDFDDVAVKFRLMARGVILLSVTDGRGVEMG